MAKNDKILIDGIIDEWVEQNVPSNKRDEVFDSSLLNNSLKTMIC
jgi:hypothetical protein